MQQKTHVNLANLDEPPHSSNWRYVVEVLLLVGDRCVYVYLVLSLMFNVSVVVLLDK